MPASLEERKQLVEKLKAQGINSWEEYQKAKQQQLPPQSMPEVQSQNPPPGFIESRNNQSVDQTLRPPPLNTAPQPEPTNTLSEYMQNKARQYEMIGRPLSEVAAQGLAFRFTPGGPLARMGAASAAGQAADTFYNVLEGKEPLDKFWWNTAWNVGLAGMTELKAAKRVFGSMKTMYGKLAPLAMKSMRDVKKLFPLSASNQMVETMYQTLKSNVWEESANIPTSSIAKAIEEKMNDLFTGSPTMYAGDIKFLEEKLSQLGETKFVAPRYLVPVAKSIADFASGTAEKAGISAADKAAMWSVYGKIQSVVEEEAAKGSESALAVSRYMASARYNGAVNRVLDSINFKKIPPLPVDTIDVRGAVKEASAQLWTEVEAGNLKEEQAAIMKELMNKLQYLEKPTDLVARTMQEGKHLGTALGAITSLIARTKLGVSLWAGASGGAATGFVKSVYSDALRLLLSIDSVPGGRDMVKQMLKETKGTWTNEAAMMFYRMAREFANRTLSGKEYFPSPTQPPQPPNATPEQP